MLSTVADAALVLWPYCYFQQFATLIDAQTYLARKVWPGLGKGLSFGSWSGSSTGTYHFDVTDCRNASDKQVYPHYSWAIFVQKQRE